MFKSLFIYILLVLEFVLCILEGFSNCLSLVYSL